MATTHERLGKAVEAVEVEREAHANTLNLLMRLVKHELAIDEIVISETSAGLQWAIVPHPKTEKLEHPRPE